MNKNQMLQEKHKNLLHELRNRTKRNPDYYQSNKYRNQRIKDAKLCNCSIDEYGLCKTTRKQDRAYMAFIKPGVCCCANCWIRVGYHDYNILPHNLPFILKEFLPIVGFWRLDGCALPRRMRSITCVGFRCEKG